MPEIVYCSVKNLAGICNFKITAIFKIVFFVCGPCSKSFSILMHQGMEHIKKMKIFVSKVLDFLFLSYDL